MTRKIFALSAAALTLTAACLSAEASLVINNQSTVDKIQVKCGTVPGVPISKGQQVHLEWRTIKIILNNRSQGSCDFYQGARHLGMASLEINPSATAAKITALAIDANSPIKAILNTQVGVEQTEIRADIQDV